MNREEAEVLVLRLLNSEKLLESEGGMRTASQRSQDYFAELTEERDLLQQQVITTLCEDKWIPIADLPEPYKDFLVWLPLEDLPVEIGYFTHESGEICLEGGCFPLSNVTHYQPLPEGPGEED